MKCSVNFSRIMAHKNTRVFSHDKVENKLFKASVCWMNDSRIHRNMKIARDDSAAKLAFVWFFCCYLPARLFRNFTFNYRKKAEKKSRKRSNIVQLADGVTAVAQLYALYSHRARSFNQWQRVLYLNFNSRSGVRLRLVFLPTLLSCSSRFLRALQQNRAQSRLLYLFYNK